ncbi:crotonase/enoyl-CoA hydratase family protein [Nocardioides sp.]|uniref:crotonase/enoyl-CoA hydratase family protein n=1 Tax=Nocardioides sp. TaxID=35761 RepID=UPI0035188EBB
MAGEATAQPTGEDRALPVERDGHVAVLTLAGPGGKPVMDDRFFDELHVAITSLDADPEVRAIVITGGRNFSFGLDLGAAFATFAPLFEDAGAGARGELLSLIRRWQHALDAVASARTPTIAAIGGWCIGGGVDLAAACDIRVASADATLSVREAKMAIVADLGSLQRLVGIIGDGHLRELALTADDIDAERALSIGLVNDVHPDLEATLDAAKALAARIAANSPLVLAGVKDVLDAERAPRIEAGLRYTAVWNSAFLVSDDLKEALTSFAERREPRFTGR